LARLGFIDVTKDSETLTRREQLLGLWLSRRAVPSVRPQKYTLAWAMTFINWYARRRHEKACRLADVADDKLLYRALAGDVAACLELGMSSPSDPRESAWQNWKGKTPLGNAIHAAFVLAFLFLTIYGIGLEVYASFKWGLVGPPDVPSSYLSAPSGR
jgi:hypothetical protein